MKEYKEGLRLVKEISQSDEISYIMNNLNSKPLNELRRYIGMKEVEPTRMRKHEEEYKKMKDEKKPETDLIIDRIERSKQQNRVPSADWIRDKLGISQGLADRFEGYCNPDEASTAIREYRKKNGLSGDVPLCNEIRDVLEGNGSIINEILDSLREGKLTMTYLRIYKVDEYTFGLSLLRLYSSIDATNTYENEFVGYFKLDEAVDIIVDFFKNKKISRLLLEKEIAKVVHRAVIFKGIEMMEEEEKKLAAREAIIDMAKGLGKVVAEGKNDGERN